MWPTGYIGPPPPDHTGAGGVKLGLKQEKKGHRVPSRGIRQCKDPEAGRGLVSSKDTERPYG